MKRIYLIDATVAQMEAWIRSQTGEDPRVLFEDDYRRDQPMYKVELENYIYNAVQDHVEAGGDLDP